MKSVSKFKFKKKIQLTVEIMQKYSSSGNYNSMCEIMINKKYDM